MVACTEWIISFIDVCISAGKIFYDLKKKEKKRFRMAIYIQTPIIHLLLENTIREIIPGIRSRRGSEICGHLNTNVRTNRHS